MGILPYPTAIVPKGKDKDKKVCLTSFHYHLANGVYRKVEDVEGVGEKVVGKVEKEVYPLGRLSIRLKP